MLAAPQVTVIYRGFLIVPPALPPGQVQSIDFQYTISNDDSNFGDWQDLATGYAATNFRLIHDALHIDIYYSYRYRIRYTNRTVSDWSDYTIAGNGQVGPENIYAGGSATSLDQLASSLGTITSGFLRGVVFETSANYPKVRMDPTGFYAISGLNNPGAIATPVFIPSDPSTPITFSGTLKNCTLTSWDQSTSIAAAFQANINSIRWVSSSDFTPLAQITARAVNNATPVGQLAVQAGGSALGVPTNVLATPAVDPDSAYSIPKPPPIQGTGDSAGKTRYYFVVTAINSTGETQASSVYYIDIINTLNGASFKVTWTPVSGATGYNIYWTTTGNLNTTDTNQWTGSTVSPAFPVPVTNPHHLAFMNWHFGSPPPLTNNAITPNTRVLISGDGVSDYDPVGSITLFATSNFPPSGNWMQCNGAAIDRTTYSNLFRIIGTTFGAGNGTTTFNIPNITGPVANVIYMISVL